MSSEQQTALPSSLAVTLTSKRRSPRRARWVLPVALSLVLAVVAPAGAQEPEPTTPGPPDTATPETPPDPSAGDPTTGVTEPPEGEAPPEPAPMPLDPSPHVRVLVAHFAIFDAQARLAVEQLALVDAQAMRALADAGVQQAEQRLTTEVASLELARKQLRDFAVTMFIHAEGGMKTGTEIDEFGVFESRKGKQLTDSVLEHRITLIDEAERRIDEATQALAARRHDAEAAAQLVAEREASVADADKQLRDANQELRVAQRADVLVPFVRDPDDTDEFPEDQPERGRRAVVRGEGAAEPQWELTIEGASIFTPEELAAWFAQFQIMPTLARAPANDLARWFVEEGAVEGLRGDVAFAQAILETGSFTNLDTVNHNNYSGIGHCDSCPSGWTFPSPQAGVRAQIQLLKSYVYEQPEYKNDLVDRRLRGPAGCCQTWNELSGVWASAGGYGAHIMRIYQDMLEWLFQQRTGRPPPVRPAGPA